MRQTGHQLAHTLRKQVVVDLPLRGFLGPRFWIGNLPENLLSVGRIAVVGHEFELRRAYEIMRRRALYPQFPPPFPKGLEYLVHQIFGQFGITRALIAYGKYLFPMRMVELFKRLVGLNEQWGNIGGRGRQCGTGDVRCKATILFILSPNNERSLGLEVQSLRFKVESQLWTLTSKL